MDDVEWNSAMDMAISIVRTRKPHTFDRECIDHLDIIIEKLRAEKITDKKPVVSKPKKIGATTIRWGKSGVNKQPSKSEIKVTMRLIQRKADTSNAISINVRDEMYEWLKDNLIDAYIKIVLDGNDNNGLKWIIIGIDEATVMAEYKKI